MMKRTITVVISILLVTATVFILPVETLAASANIQLGDYYKQYYYDENHVLYEKIFDENGNEVDLDEEEFFTMSVGDTIPSSYDSRDYGFVTSVKDQNPYGSCWAFAFTAAAESSLVAQGYTSNDIDLSEAHLIWFRKANKIEGSAVPVQQDSVDWVRDTFNDGGSDFDAVVTAARWSGLALESRFPYVNSNDSSSMQFASSAMFVNNYNLVSARQLTKNNAAEIKKAIMQYGAVSATMYYTNDAINYSPNGCCHFQKKVGGVNHGVTVVGWDDNFAVSNFKIAPPAKGAWLIKNSWGTDVNDNGYFWLSYSDKSCGNFMEVVAKPSGDYDYNYQYDGQQALASIAYTRTAYGANVFTANGYEKVKGAGFYTFNNASYTCTVSLYTGLTDSANPTSGTLRETKNLSCTKKGYYTADFDGEYDVEPGEKFAVVVKYNNTSGSAFIPYENLYTTDYTYGVEEGQSFYSGTLSNWKDVTDDDKGNIPIKAFTKSQFSVPSLQSISVTEVRNNVYTEGGSFNPDDITVTAFMSDGTSFPVNSDELIITGFDSSASGTMTISYNGLTTSFSYLIQKEEAASVEVNTLPLRLIYTVGEDFDASGLTINVLYPSGKTETVTDGFTCEVSMAEAGVRTVTVRYGDLFTTFEITVEEIVPVPTAIKIIALPKTEYASGEAFASDGLELNLVYSDGRIEKVTEGFTVSAADTLALGQKTVKVEYCGFEAEYQITVGPAKVVSLTVIKNPDKTEYVTGEMIDASGLSLNATYSDGTVKKVNTGYTISPDKASGSGSKTVKVTYQGVKTSFKIHVTFDLGQLIRNIFRSLLTFSWLRK